MIMTMIIVNHNAKKVFKCMPKLKQNNKTMLGKRNAYLILLVKL